jgi:hypothetical protein
MPREKTQPSSPGSRTFNWTGKGLKYRQKRKCERTLYCIINDRHFSLEIFSLNLNWTLEFQSTRYVSFVYSEFRITFLGRWYSLSEQRILWLVTYYSCFWRLICWHKCSNGYWSTFQWDSWTVNPAATETQIDLHCDTVQSFQVNLRTFFASWLTQACLYVCMSVCLHMDYVEPIHRLKILTYDFT